MPGLVLGGRRLLDGRRPFEFVTDAELIGISQCPFSQHEWDVVPVERPKAA